MPKYANAATTPLKNEKDKYLGSLTLSNYDSTTNKVFDGSVLADLYAALTGVEGANLQTVANDLVGTRSEMYGYSKKVNLPEYKTAAQLYELNDNHNITVNLNGQEFAVSFLTTDNNGHVIATLWMTQPLADGDTPVTGKMGWATAAYEVDYTTSIGESYISNAYSTSMVRMKVLNAGPTDGTATAYAMGTSNANVPSLNQSVDSETRKGNLLAPFTLDNSALVGTGYANKSLIEYLVQPSQVEYTYWLDWPATSGSKANTSYPLNETLTSPLYLSTSVGKTTTKFYGGESNGSHLGYWWNAGVYNYATSTVNHYNDWGDDYIWIPSITETGHATADGFWATGSSTTGQIRFNQEGTKDTETLAGTKVSTEHVWLRTGNPTSPSNSRFLSSSGTAVYAYSAATLAVRPALHLDLTAADESKVLNKPTADNTQFIYDGMEKTYTPKGYNSNAMEITGNVQTNANENGYKVTVTPKNGLTWADGTADPVSFTFIIKKADSIVTPELAYDEMKVNALYNTMQISDLILMVDPTKNPKPTKGTFKWSCDTTQLIEEDGVYSWEFTPADEYINNYNTSKGTFTVTNVTADVLKDISVETNEDFDSAEFYTSDTYSVLRSYLTVTAVYQSGLSKTVATYGFGTAAGALNSSNLTAGENISVPICYETKSKTITIPKVTAVIVESLNLLFIQSTAKIDITNNLNDLKDINGISLIVTATFNNTDTKSVDNFELKLVDGTAFKVGANEFYAVYGGVESNRVTVNVSKAVYDISALKFEDKLAPYTGEAYDTEGWVTGLPTGVTVTYSCETDMTEIGKHIVTAHFSGDYENYEAIADMTATLTIENNYALPEFVEDTLYYNPAGNTFEILNFEGIKDIVKLTINGENISDIAEALTQTEIGEYTLVITLTNGKFLGDSQSVTLTFSIVKRVVALPEYNGSLVYSGKSQTPIAEDFVYDGLGCYFVSAESGLNAGTYNARFVLTDTEHYEWASASTRRAVRYALTDGELNGGEIQVPWTIAKATVSATAEDGKMPAFTCATVSDLSKYITYTYYKDELCTEAVAFADLQPDTRYYVKATFTDEDGNFELDDSALGVISGTASYDTAPKEPSFIQKAFAYVKEHWLWFAIGAGVLLFLIILIIIIAATSKKRKAKAEERKAEKKEEERQRRAEEREERMMRMQMGGQMPITAAGMLAAQQAQAQPQPQPVQQQAPAQAQPVQSVQQTQQQLPVQQNAQQQTMPVYGQGADNTALLMAKLEAEFARQAQQRSEKELAESKLQSEFEKLRAELRASGRLPVNGEMHAIADGQNSDIEMIGMLAAAIWRNIKSNGTAATSERLAGQIQTVQQTEAEPAANISYPNNAIITTTTTVDTTKGKEGKPTRNDGKLQRTERDGFSDLDGFYESYEE